MVKSLLFAFAILLGGIAADNVQIDTEKSKIEWTGRKVVPDSHNGILKLSEGSLKVENGELKGGSFVIDMTNFNVQDLKGKKKANLEGHLSNDDFFSTDKFPTAKLVITKVSKKDEANYTVVGDMTIKGITLPVIFDTKMSKEGEGYKAEASFEFDRTKFGVKYKSGTFFDDLKEKAIKDNIELKVTLFTK